MRISDWSSDVCSSDLIRRALRADDKKCSLLAVGLEAVLREGAERIVPQGFPEFVDVDHKPPAVEETVDQVEHVHHERRANFGVVEKIGHVETDERRLQRQSVDLIVEHPAERTAPRPFLQSGTNAFRVTLTEQLAKRETGPVLRSEASKRGQPLVDHTLLCEDEPASDRLPQIGSASERDGGGHAGLYSVMAGTV